MFAAIRLPAARRFAATILRATITDSDIFIAMLAGIEFGMAKVKPSNFASKRKSEATRGAAQLRYRSPAQVYDEVTGGRAPASDHRALAAIISASSRAGCCRRPRPIRR